MRGMDETIRPTGNMRALGWSLLSAGVLLLVIVFPLFTVGGATDDSATGTLLTAIGALAPWLGLVAIGTAVVLLVMASKRGAANREAVQRATLAQRGPDASSQ